MITSLVWSATNLFRSLNGDAVRLKDGRCIKPDAVVCATGIRLGLEGLVGHPGVLDEQGRPRIVADKHSPAHAGL